MKKIIAIALTTILLSGCSSNKQPNAPSPSQTPKAVSASQKEEPKDEKPSEKDVKAALEAFEVEVKGTYLINGKAYSSKYFVGNPKNVEITSIEPTVKQTYSCKFVSDFANEYIYLVDRNAFTCDVIIDNDELSIKNFTPEEGQEMTAKSVVPFDLDCIYDYGKELKFFKPGRIGDAIVEEKLELNRENVPKIEIYHVYSEDDFCKEYGLYFTLKDGRTLECGSLKFDYVDGKWINGTSDTIGRLPIVDR